MEIKNEITKKFIYEKINELTIGKTEQHAIESLNYFLENDIDFIKAALIDKVNEKKKELVKQLVTDRDNLRAEYTRTKERLNKYDEDIKKLENFKKSFK